MNGQHDHDDHYYTKTQVDALFDNYYTRAEVDELLATPVPPLPPSGPVVWANDFEDGSLLGQSETSTGSDFEKTLRFSSDGGTLHDVITDPTGRSAKVLRMTGDTSDGGQSGNRARLNGWLNSDVDPWNLPEIGTYEFWFYLMDNQTSNNIAQWKQAWSNDLSDTSKWQTRTPLHWIRVNHVSNGVHNMFLRASFDEDGTIPAGSNRTAGRIDGQVQAGRWHHLKLHHKYSETDGFIQAWLDGVLWVDLTGIRTHARTIQDAAFGDPLPGQPTYIKQFGQFTVNNYMIKGSGSWNPKKTTIYFDELKITRG